MNYKEFKAQYQKVPVKESTNQVPATPLVSVCVQTYQHAPYIRECLEGILMQETNFPFEILIGEDASTDGTREICIDYANKYVDKIRLFLHHRENNIRVMGLPTSRYNILTNMFSAKGKYIAICEGDDYWTDSRKLQKQIDNLKNNSNAAANFTNALVKNELTNSLYDYHNIKMAAIIDNNEIIQDGGSIYPTCSLVYRNNIINYGKFIRLTEYLTPDMALIYLLAYAGKISYINQKTCVYRRWTGGVYSSIINDKEKLCSHKKNIIPGLVEYNKITDKKYNHCITKKISQESLYILRNGNLFQNFRYFKYLTHMDFVRLIKSYLRSIKF